MGHWGPACLSVEAIEFVTAGGKNNSKRCGTPRLLLGQQGDADRGESAVATRFHLKCLRLPKAMISSVYFSVWIM